MTQRFVLAALGATALATAGCGGGGGSSPSPLGLPASNPTGNPPASGMRTLGIGFAGTSSLSTSRAALDLYQTPVTVTMNGAVIGAGVIDQNGKTKITLKAGVPAGATIAVIAGKVTATYVIAMSAAATASLVTVNGDGTLGVSAAADPNNTGLVTPDEDEHQSEREDMNGNVIEVDNTQASVLPANLPFALANSCSTIALSPIAAADAFVEFEEKNDDNDMNSADAAVHFEGAFTAALRFPAIGTATRIHVIVYDASRKQINEVKAPITAFSVGAQGACATPSPAPGATATATPRPPATPAPTPSPAPSATGTPDDRVSPTPTPAPTATASPTPH